MPAARGLLRGDRPRQPPRRDQDDQDAGWCVRRRFEFRGLCRGAAVTRRAFVHRLGMRAPDDVAGLEAMIGAGFVDPASILAIFGKTEGNGCVNDFSRGFAVRALQAALSRSGADGDGVNLVMSGGTEGALSPHMLVFEAREVAERPQDGALAIGRARTPALPPEALGRLRQVDAVAAGVKAAMADAGVRSPEAVHFVQIKCPLLT